MEEKKIFWSNCLIEAIKAKIKYRKEVKIIRIPKKYNGNCCDHYAWHDLVDNNIYEFDNINHKYIGTQNIPFLFKGYIKIRPYSVYERWLKAKEW